MIQAGVEVAGLVRPHPYKRDHWYVEQYMTIEESENVDLIFEVLHPIAYRLDPYYYIMHEFVHDYPLEERAKVGWGIWCTKTPRTIPEETTWWRLWPGKRFE